MKRATHKSRYRFRSSLNHAVFLSTTHHKRTRFVELFFALKQWPIVLKWKKNGIRASRIRPSLVSKEDGRRVCAYLRHWSPRDLQLPEFKNGLKYSRIFKVHFVTIFWHLFWLTLVFECIFVVIYGFLTIGTY